MKKYDERIKNIIIATVIFIAIYLMFFCCAIAQGQNVVRKGNTFIEQKDTVQKPKAQETDYVFVDKDGQAYPVWVSSKGKYFIIKVSKRTGKEYRKYLPELTKILTKYVQTGSNNHH